MSKSKYVCMGWDEITVSVEIGGKKEESKFKPGKIVEISDKVEDSLEIRKLISRGIISKVIEGKPVKAKKE